MDGKSKRKTVERSRLTLLGGLAAAAAGGGCATDEYRNPVTGRYDYRRPSKPAPQGGEGGEGGGGDGGDR